MTFFKETGLETRFEKMDSPNFTSFCHKNIFSHYFYKMVKKYKIFCLKLFV